MADFALLMRRSALVFTAYLLVTMAMHPSAMAAFNPNEGAEPQPAATQALPSIEPLMGNRYPRSVPQPIKFQPLPEVSSAPIPQPAPVTNVMFPKIDAATVQSTFIAPAPLIAPVPAAPVPVAEVTPAPTPVTAPVVATAPAIALVPATAPVVNAVAPLSRDSKEILSHVPSKLDAEKPAKGGKLAVNRIAEMPDMQIKGKVDAYEASGIKISVRRPGLDTNYELNRAYNALSGGDSEVAMEIYKNILSTEPKNADALFGLASLYHRQGQLQNARQLYGTLLKYYPTHRDGLNNFLALVSEESPQEALAELERLEQRNSGYSPIPAQQALLLNKLGYANEARSKMLRAIELSPDNLTYKYNLAIMLDKQGNYDDAADLYRLLLDAAMRGEAIPSSPDALQKRLNYIARVNVAATPAG